MTRNHPRPEARGRVHLLLLICLAAAFAAVLVWMLNLRLSAGDTYAPYSSLRADPLGCRVLHDALGRMKGMSTGRHTRAMHHLKSGPESAVLIMALDPSDLNLSPAAKEDELIDGLLDQGSLLLIALDREESLSRVRPRGLLKPGAPNTQPEPPSSEPKPEKDEPAEDQDHGKQDQKQNDEDDEEDKPISVFGLSAKPCGKPLDKAATQQGQGALAGIPIPPWRGSHFLTIEEGSAWQPLATVDGEVTIARLDRGKGTILVTSDVYPFSNEAQLRDRHSSFMLSLLEGRTRIIFDEYHLGVSTNPGIMRLVRDNHLHGLIAGGLLLLMLLFWQGASSLIPSRRDRDLGIGNHGAVSGRDSAEGLVALLETGLKPQALLTECIARHRKNATVNPPTVETLRAASAIAATTHRSTLASDFERIAKLFSIKQSTTPPANPKPNPDHGPD